MIRDGPVAHPRLGQKRHLHSTPLVLVAPPLGVLCLVGRGGEPASYRLPSANLTNNLTGLSDRINHFSFVHSTICLILGFMQDARPTANAVTKLARGPT